MFKKPLQLCRGFLRICYIHFMEMKVLFTLLSLCVVWLPSHQLVYSILWHGQQNGYVYGRSLYSFWRLKKRLAFGLLFMCEVMKVMSIFFIISLWFQDDIFAFYISFLIACLQTFQINLHGSKKMKISKSLAPFWAFYILLSPMTALILGLFYAGNILISRRSSFSAVNTLFLAPVILLMMVNFDLPYYLGLVLPLILLIGYKKDVLQKYPFKESLDI